MQWLLNVLMLVQVISAIGIIVLVLLQHGKGADMGAAFGGGSSGSLFGATGSANFLSRTTAVFAGVFFVCTLGLAMLVNHKPAAPGSVMDAVSGATREKDAGKGDAAASGATPTTSVKPSDVPSANPAERQSGSGANTPTPAPAPVKSSQPADIPK
ncbi:MAG: preprotein translocase subunit SecG [Burkholderiaceae bacterium]|nr:preprotein translocase subunit SecG [Burkholderiaceae bacterium]